MSARRSRGVGAVLVAALFGLGLAEGGGCSSTASAGAEAQACYPNDTCNAGLTCKSHKCVKGTGGVAGGGDADGSTSSAGGGGNAGVTDGAAGVDGATDADGTADADGTTDAEAVDGAADAADAVDGEAGPACNVSPSYGPLNFAAAVQSAVGSGDVANGASPRELDWNAPLNTDVKPDILDLALLDGQAPFAHGIAAMDAIDLAGQDDFKTCGACVLIIAHADTTLAPLKAGEDYIATSGTLTLTAVPTLPLDATSRVTGTLTNVVFKHVKINSTFVTTKVDDCTIKISSASFNAVVNPTP